MSNKSSGIAFEKYCMTLFTQCGCHVQETPSSGDYGADLLIHYDNLLIACQCKFYSQTVGISAVQEIIASLPIYHADAGIVISNNTFTTAAHNLANANRILLISGNTLPRIQPNTNRRIDIFDEWLGTNRNHTTQSSYLQPIELTMDDLVARYGLSRHMIIQYFFSSGLPYYKVGRSNVVNLDELKRWEVFKQCIILGRGQVYYLPEWMEYFLHLKSELKLAKRNRDGKHYRRVLSLIKKHKNQFYENEQATKYLGVFLGIIMTIGFVILFFVFLKLP